MEASIRVIYTTAIECKTLYGHRVPHTAFPNAIAKQQLQQQSLKEHNKPTGSLQLSRNKDPA